MAAGVASPQAADVAAVRALGGGNSGQSKAAAMVCDAPIGEGGVLRLTGRMPPLTQLPLAEALGRRGAPELRRLFAGANKLTNDTVVGLCSNGAGRSLEHAGLSYNRITALPPPAALAGGLPVLISLDLSHNDLCDLGAFVRAVSALPMLRCLWAEGNPLVLVQHWRKAVLSALPRLVRLDDAAVCKADRKFDSEADADLTKMLLQFQPEDVAVRVAVMAPRPSANLFEAQRSIAAARREAAIAELKAAKRAELREARAAGGGAGILQAGVEGAEGAEGEGEGEAAAAEEEEEVEIDEEALPPAPCFEYAVRLQLPTGEWVSTARSSFRAEGESDGGEGGGTEAGSEGNEGDGAPRAQRYAHMPVGVSSCFALRSGFPLELVRYELEQAEEGGGGEGGEAVREEGEGEGERKGEVVATGVAAVPSLLMSAGATSAATRPAAVDVVLVTPQVRLDCIVDGEGGPVREADRRFFLGFALRSPVCAAQPLLDDRSVLLLAATRDEVADAMCEVAVEVELHVSEAEAGGGEAAAAEGKAAA